MSGPDEYPTPEPFEPPSLTDEQRARLEAGPGLITNPVGTDMVSAREYMEDHAGNLNNFPGYFEDSDSLIGSVYRTVRCRQRFAILYPAFTTELEELVAASHGQVQSTSANNLDPRFIKAYELMRRLVDRNDDERVMCEDNAVNYYYLTQ